MLVCGIRLRSRTGVQEGLQLVYHTTQLFSRLKREMRSCSPAGLILRQRDLELNMPVVAGLNLEVGLH